MIIQLNISKRTEFEKKGTEKSLSVNIVAKKKQTKQLWQTFYV